MDLIVAALCVWRICHLILREEGPLHLCAWFRTVTYRYRVLRPLATCLPCLSVWIGVPAAGLYLLGYWWLMLPFALSAASMLIQGVVNG